MRRRLIDREHPQLSVRRQCELLRVNRNRLEDRDRDLEDEELRLRRRIDEIFLEHPVYGSRQMTRALRKEHFSVGRKRVRRAMRVMGLRAIYPRPRTSIRAQEHLVYPYLLRDRTIDAPDQAWCTDITYIPMARGFAYLVAIMDWHTRAVLSWELSNTLETGFCVRALERAVKQTGRCPEIFNTDQGCQFTSKEWITAVEGRGIKVSMDGKGRWVDNVFIERLWRSLKYEDIYLREYRDLEELRCGLDRWFAHYNHDRPHSAHDGRSPWEIYRPTPEQQAA